MQKLVCVRVADDPEGEAIVSGSAQRWCATCAEPVWVSPSSMIHIDRRDMQGQFELLCSVCLTGELARLDPDEPVDVTPMPGAIEELKRFLEESR